jgi:DNA-binding NarL/FixJ family response regulator
VETIKVLLAEDIPLLRKGMRSMLAAYPDIEIAGEAGDGLEAVRLSEELSPHVVLMDLSMPRMSGEEAIAEIARRKPEIRVIALTASPEPERVRLTLKAGAAGYLLKNATAMELARAIRGNPDGSLCLSPEVKAALDSQDA